MSIRNKFRSKLINVLVGEKTQSAKRSLAETRRKISGGAHVVSAFLELDDPYSYLLAHYLPNLVAAYDVEVKYYLVQSCNDEAYRPEPEMQDCTR